MSGKEIVISTLKQKKTKRIPWVPFIGCHAAKIINKSATEYLQSADLMVEGINKSIELYKPDGIPIMFDLQVEAEALGCKLAWSDENPPAVISHILNEGKTINDLKIPGERDGRIPVVINTAKKIREQHPDIALYGLITGPFTLALHLLGTDLFLKMMETPAEVAEIIEFTKNVGIKMASLYINAGCDIIAVVDPMTSQIDPLSFETFVTSPATEIFDYIREHNALSSFFVCGHAQQNIEVMCNCKPDNISIDENIPLDYVKEIALKHNISFGGNMKLTVVLLMGNKEDVQNNAMECMEMGGNKGFILAPGCDIPMDTPPENIQAVTELVNDSYIQDIVKAKEKSDTNIEILNMKDYGQADKVIVDIITLDSESCAPCQYMVESVKNIAPHFEGIVEWREHAIKKMEAVTFMNSLMVRNIPTICIDGKIAFVSRIPPKNELIDAIQKRINEKIKLLISSKKAEFLILGTDQDMCNAAKVNLDMAMKETGKNIRTTISYDEKLIASYGISNTPAIIITEHKIKSQGEVPVVAVIKEWLKEL